MTVDADADFQLTYTYVEGAEVLWITADEDLL